MDGKQASESQSTKVLLFAVEWPGPAPLSAAHNPAAVNRQQEQLIVGLGIHSGALLLLTQPLH